MAAYTEPVAVLHKALTGSDQLGAYPDSVVDRLNQALDAAWDLADATGVAAKVPVIAGEEPGPWRVPRSLLDDADQQVRARFRHDDQSRWRTLAEAARQLEAILAVLPDGAAPPPAPGGTPTPSIVPASAKLVGLLDFDTGDLSQWQNLQTRDRNGAPGSYSTWRASVRDGGTGHPKAARFEVRDGDVPNFGGGERSEVRAGARFDVQPGSESWYSWSTRLGDAGGGFPDAKGWGLIVMQWHTSEGSPPLSIHAQGRQLSLRNDRAGGWTRNICPIDPGVWHDYVLRVQWRRNGLIEMWRDREKLTSFNATPVVGNESAYLKAGIYRSSENTATHVVWHDNLRPYTV